MGPLSGRQRMTQRVCKLKVNSLASRGFGLLEFLMALLVFSIGLLGLNVASMTAKKTTFESAQYSLATTLATDLLQRVRANSGQLSQYLSEGGQWLGEEPDEPEVNCQSHNCSASQLAHFDLWQWHNALLGAATSRSQEAVPVLRDVRACFTQTDGTVTVVLNWLGTTRHTLAGEEECGLAAPQAHAVGPRRQIALSTFIAGPL